MKLTGIRFFAVAGFSYLFSLFFSNFFINNRFLWIFIVSCIFFCFIVAVAMFYFFTKNKTSCKEVNNRLTTFYIVFLFSFIAFGASLFNYQSNILPIRQFDNKDITITGQIVELPSKTESGGYNYIFKVKNIHGVNKPNNFKILLSSSSPIEANVFDEFTGSIHIFVPLDTAEFPAEKFYRAKRIYAKAFLYDHKPTKVKPLEGGLKPLYYYALKMRQRLILTINSIFPQRQASVINGMMLGNRGAVPNDIKENFDRIGVYHLLAISGVHVSILTNIFTLMLKKLRFSERKSSIIVSVLIFVFMAVTCFTPSVIRAGMMCIIYLLSSFFSRKPDPINSLGIAVLAITLFSPDAGLDIGLWLSFSATLGILVLMPKLKGYCKNKGLLKFAQNTIFSWVFYYIINSIFVTLSATIFTFPIVAFYFKKISIISFFSNILLIFPVSAMLFFAIVLVVLYLFKLPLFLILPLKIVCGVTVNYIIICSSLLAKIPFATIYLNKTFTTLWIVINIIFILIMYYFVKFKKYYIKFYFLPLFSIFSIMFLNILFKMLKKDLTKISVVNSGEGVVLVCNKNEHSSAIFCLNEKTFQQKILEYFYSNGINKIDNLIILSFDQQNIDFINNFIEKYSPSDIIFSTTEAGASDKYFNNKNIKYLEKNFHLNIFDTTEIFIERLNGTKLIFFKTLGIKTLVCPFGGNANDIKNDWLKCDIFIAGGLPFDYNKVNSDFIIISMVKKDFDIIYPKINIFNKRLFSTAELGTIDINISRKGSINIGPRS